MTIWALADLHLCLGVPAKTMEVFGPGWVEYVTRMRDQWCAVVQPDDLVLIAGDISWAMRLEEAAADLLWIHQLPGTKVLIRGNHDYWWESLKKVRAVLPPSLHVIQNDAFEWNEFSIGGSRLWDTAEHGAIVDPAQEQIYERELQRLEMSLQAMQQQQRIVMTHYPPIGKTLQPTRASRLLERYKVTICVFGHLHGLEVGSAPFGQIDGITYHLTASDYLGFMPKKIL